MKERNNFVALVACLTMGALGGYLTGILTAKKTGKELREDISNETEKITRKAKDNILKLRNQAEQKVGKFQQTAMKKYEEIKNANKGKKFNLANQINQIFNRSKSEA